MRVEKSKEFPPGTFEMEKETNSKTANFYKKSSSGSDFKSNSSISSLITHNQDLASRLNVAVSRNINLEKNISRLNKVFSQYEARFQSAKDQIGLYREKEKFLQNENLTLKQKIQKVHAHLSHERKETANEIKNLKSDLAITKPAVEEYRKLKSLVEKEYLPERDLLKERLSEKDEELLSFEQERKELLKKLGEASEHIQKLAHDFKNKLESTEAEHKSKLQEFEEKLDAVQNENIVLSDRNRVLRKEQIEKTELLNRIEDIKKEKEISINESQDEKEDLLQQLSKAKKENDRLKIENHGIKKQWANTQSEYRTHKAKVKDQEEEVASLRALWQEKTSNFSQASLQNDSLNKQLQDLETRLKHASEMHSQTKQRLNFFFSQLEMIKSKQSDSYKEATENMEKAFKKAIEPLTDFDYNL